VKFKGEYESEKAVYEQDVKVRPEIKNEPVVRFVHRVNCHTNTVRFDSELNSRPFDSIYVPCSLLKGYENEKLLQIVIKWG